MVQFDLSEMTPHSEINSILSRARSLRVVGPSGEVYEDRASLEIDAQRVVTLTLMERGRKRKIPTVGTGVGGMIGKAFGR